MFWIIGGDAFAGAFRNLNGGPVARWLGYELGHSDWAGFTFYDLIFPLFVFMIGVSITLSLGRLIERQGRAGAVNRIVRRTVLLFALGIVYYGGFSRGVDQIRLLGVLQRLALCYFFASLVFVFLKPRLWFPVFAGLLVGYWALMTFVPVPGYGAGDFAERHNLANWIDKLYLPLHQHDGDYDPEGLLSTIPAVATCLLGLMAGRFIQDVRRAPIQRATWLVGAGVAAILLGTLWGLQFPVIKKIWTSSFVLVAGGWSLVLLGVFYLLIDVWNRKTWALPFVWIGTNALTIYLLSHFIDFGHLSAALAGGPIAAAFDSLVGGLGGVVLAFLGVGLCTLICRFLYQRSVFLRL